MLNGAPRSGKSSVVRAIQDRLDGVWMNLGVDVFVEHITPPAYRPGMGLRPGERGHPLAALQPAFYAAVYDSIAAHARAGLDVVTDIGHHDETVLRDCALRLAGVPALLVGIRCPIDEIMRRRNAGEPGREGRYATGPVDDPPAPVALWQRAVHEPGIYDLELDTSRLSPNECADAIQRRMAEGPGTAFERLVALG